jgi:hypothetical protein
MPEEEWIVFRDENIPAIVSEETWDRANALFKQRSEKMKETGGSYSARYPLSGKLFCGEHGESYHRHIYKSKKKGEQEVWNCRLYRLKGKTEGCDSPTIYTSEIEKVLADIYRDIYENRETLIEQMVDIYSRSGGSRDFAKDIAATEKEIAALNERKEKLLDLMMDETITRAEFKKRNDGMNAEIEAKLNEINQAKNARELAAHLKREVGSLKDSISELYNDPQSLAEGLTPAFLDKIIVHKIDGDKRHVRLEIRLNIGKTYHAEWMDNHFILSHEIGISQAQVSRLEKSALSRIKKQI